MRALDITGEPVSFDSKPQQSWPTRALDIMGKLFFGKPQRSQPTRAQDISGKLYPWWQSCQRVLMGQPQDHAKNGLNRRVFFCGQSNSTCINLDTKVDVIGHF